jgi:hypothetical protein
LAGKSASSPFITSDREWPANRRDFSGREISGPDWMRAAV